MIAVRDPLGTDQFDAGGHGSAFDRVGAFQVGFIEGTGRCADLLDEPLPLVDAPLRPAGRGNSPFGYGDDDIVPIIVNDLNGYWPQLLSTIGATLPVLDDRARRRRPTSVECDDPAAVTGTGVVYCPSTQQIFFDEPLAIDLYDRFGDFVVGYLLGSAWSEAAQHALGSPLTGEERVLASDCLTGAWVADLIPDEAGRTPRRDAHRVRRPRRGDPDGTGRSATRRPATTSSAAVSRRSPPSAKVCSVASTPAPQRIGG